MVDGLDNNRLLELVHLANALYLQMEKLVDCFDALRAPFWRVVTFSFERILSIKNFSTPKVLEVTGHNHGTFRLSY